MSVWPTHQQHRWGAQTGDICRVEKGDHSGSSFNEELLDHLTSLLNLLLFFFSFFFCCCCCCWMVWVGWVGWLVGWVLATLLYHPANDDQRCFTLFKALHATLFTIPLHFGCFWAHCFFVCDERSPHLIIMVNPRAV
jgi:hypothetical protein